MKDPLRSTPPKYSSHPLVVAVVVVAVVVVGVDLAEAVGLAEERHRPAAVGQLHRVVEGQVVDQVPRVALPQPA